MATYWFSFGDANPATFTALAPTFTAFYGNGTTLTPPGITEPIAGSGWYSISYSPTCQVAYTLDGITSSLGTYRYVAGTINPNVTWFGSDASSIGTTVLPTTAMGYLKRIVEVLEGDQTYTKATGLLDIYDRGGTLLLVEKTLADSTTSTTKS